MLRAVEGVGVLLDGDAALAAEAGPTRTSRGAPAFLPRQAFHLAAPYFPPARGTGGLEEEGACSENAAKKRRKREYVSVPYHHIRLIAAWWHFTNCANNQS